MNYEFTKLWKEGVVAYFRYCDTGLRLGDYGRQ
jgi:hypothetical protein